MILGVLVCGEIDVTPAMIEAGVTEFRKHCYGDDTSYRLERVYRVMAYVSASALPIKAPR
ncbi:hypothetical protein J2X41_002717 [Caulobacter sp. BE254]|nr:hypothetical protein [Caulobacter sp. BE254]